MEETDPMRVLVVDDEPLNLRLMKTLLEPLGVEVCLVDNGTEAQTLMDDQAFDLLLFDIRLPDIDGLALTQWARRHHKHKEVPILVMTALEGKPTLMKAFDAGAVDFLSRPIHPGEFSHRIKAQLRLRHMQKQMETLSDLAHRDSLTGLWNRRKAWDLMEYEAVRSKRAKRTIGVAMLDIDRFKQFNDTLGHDQGDHILRQTATILDRTLRRGDILARWGGEEFLAVFPETDVAGSQAASEKMRTAVAQAAWNVGARRSVTVSIGVAVKTPDTDWESALKHADEALYRAKESGRNRVILY